MRQFWWVVALLFLSAWVIVPAAPAQGGDGAPGDSYRVSGAQTRLQRGALVRSGAQIEGSGRGFVDIIASPETVAALRAQGFTVEPLPRPRLAVDPAYHTYDEMRAEVQDIAAANPALVSLFSIGQSYEGRELIAAKVSDNVAADEDEPEVLFVGHYHAREHLTVEMLLSILHLLVDGYGQPDHAQVDALVQSREIWLIFDLNPDGGEYDRAAGSYRYWRKNREPNPCTFTQPGDGTGTGTDLNRNHSYRWGFDEFGSSSDPCSEIYRGPAPASAPETAAIERFVASRVISGTQQINAAISFHTYGELVLWPYGYTFDEVPPDMRADDAAALAALGQAMARSNRYVPEQSSQLYTTNGDFADWAYGTHGIFAYTFEMSSYYQTTSYGFYPPGAAIPVETARNHDAVLTLLFWAGCPYGLVGLAQHCDAPRYQRIWTTALPRVEG